MCSTFNFSKYASLITNIIAVLSFVAMSIAQLISPAFATMAIPPLINLLFHFIAKFEPQDLKGVKDLLLSKLGKEVDPNVVNATYDEILTQYQKSTGRSVAISIPDVQHPISSESLPTPINEPTAFTLPSEPINDELATQRLPVTLVYNAKTKKLEYEVYNK